MDYTSFVLIKNGAIKNSSNDGMKLLGYFLINQVGERTAFLEKWLEQRTVTDLPLEKDTISIHSFLLEKSNGDIVLSNLSTEHLAPFETTHKKFLQILKDWKSICKSDAYSACQNGNHDLLIIRDLDEDTFSFKTV
jgi:hypothetical protein